MIKAAKLAKFPFEYILDLVLFLRHNGYSPWSSKSKRLFYKIIIETHTIEKGLSQPHPRKLFGIQKIQDVIRMVKSYDLSHSTLPVQMAMGALYSYAEFHRSIECTDAFLDEIVSFADNYCEKHGIEPHGGVKPMRLETEQSNHTPEQFLTSRFSFRQFDGNPVEMELARRIVEIAQSAPSQCNRQSTIVHLYQERETIDDLLDLQSGARGFSQSVGNLFVVASELPAWGGPGQRHQPYVDGSLFAMHLMMACHALNVYCCPLNLAIPNSIEKKIKQRGFIPNDQRLILMIAFGMASKDTQHCKAHSPRRNINEILMNH